MRSSILGQALGALLLVSVPLRAASVSGTVVNAVNAAPLKKAQITLRGGSGRAPLSAISDFGGHFEIAAVPPGDYMATVECQGFPQAFTWVHAGAEPVTGITIRLSPFAAISGRVVDEDGDPLVNVQVIALRPEYTRPKQSYAPAQRVTTDDRGEYRIFDLAPGSYLVEAVKAGPNASALNSLTAASAPPDSYPVVFYPNAFDAAEATPVRLAAGADIGRIDFRLRKTKLYRISGMATADGRPMNAIVKAIACAGVTSYSSSVRPDGSFEIKNVQPGNYCLAANESRGAHIFYAMRNVTVSDRDAEGIALSATPGIAVSGTVVIEGAAPARANMQVSLEPVDEPTTTSQNVERDNSFTLPETRPGSYFVKLEPLPTGFYVKRMRYGGQDISGGLLDLTAEAPLRIELARGAGEIRAVVPEAGPGVSVTIAPDAAYSNRRDLWRTQTVGSGPVRFQSLPPGDYYLVAWESNEPNLAGWDALRKLLLEGATKVTVHETATETVTLKPLSAADVALLRGRLP